MASQVHEIDEPLHEMRLELQKLEKGDKMTDSPLYRHLSKPMQDLVDEKGLSFLMEVYQFDKYNQTFMDEINSVMPQISWSFESNMAEEKSERLVSAFEDQDSEKIKKMAVSEGEMPLLTISMYLTVKRYRERFHLPNFLPCFIFSSNRKTVNLKSLNKNLVFSRWHFLLTGSYLPVVAFYLGDGHATNTLFIPRDRDLDRHSDAPNPNPHFTWHIIHINPNGFNDAYLNRFHDDPEEVIRSYREFVDSNVHTRRSDCSNDIQKIYSTCTVWCLLLTMMILRQYETFRKRSKPVIDFVNIFCFGLSRKTENAKVIDQFHDYISDLVISFRYMVFDIMFTLNLSDKLSLQNYIHEILRGSVHETIELDLRLFQAVQQAMAHFEKYVDRKSSKKLVLDYLNLENEKLGIMIHRLKKPTSSHRQPVDQKKTAEELRQLQQIQKIQQQYDQGRDVYERVLSNDDDHRYDGRPEEESDEEPEADKKSRQVQNISQRKWGVASRHIRQQLSKGQFPSVRNEDSSRKRRLDW